MHFVDLLEQGELFLDVLPINHLYYLTHFLVLAVPQHLQYLSPILRGLADLPDHLVEAGSDESLLIFELSRIGIVAPLDVLELVLEPDDEVLDLLLLGEHLLIPAFGLLQQVGIEVVVALVYVLLPLVESQLADYRLNRGQVHHRHLVFYVLGA